MHNCQLENVRLLESRRLRSRIRTVGLTPNQTRWKIVVALNVRNKKQKTYFVLDDQALENRQAVIDSRSTSLFHQRLVGLNESIDRIKMEFQQFKERKKKKSRAEIKNLHTRRLSLRLLLRFLSLLAVMAFVVFVSSSSSSSGLVIFTDDVRQHATTLDNESETTGAT
jgi:hypothetical protein